MLRVMPRGQFMLLGVCLGILASFALWAFAWALGSEEEASVELVGRVAHLTLAYDGETPPTSSGSLERELNQFAIKNKLAVVAMSEGDGRPEAVVIDPTGVVPWFPRGASDTTAFPFRGTFTDQHREGSHRSTFLPSMFILGDSIAAPRGLTEGVQYARTLTGLTPPPGRYVVTSDDPATLQQLRSIMERNGFRAAAPDLTPLYVRLLQNPLVVVTSCLLILGLLAAGLYWTLRVNSRERELYICWGHGAGERALARSVIVFGVPPLAAGVLGGAAICWVVVSLAGARAPTSTETLYVFLGAALGLIATLAGWSAVGAFTVKRVVARADRE